MNTREYEKGLWTEFKSSFKAPERRGFFYSKIVYCLNLNLSMARNPELTKARDQHVRDRFRYHRKRNPKWMIEAVIDEVAAEMFLSPVTIAKILKQHNEAVPAHSTVSRFFNKAICTGQCQQLTIFG